MKNLRDIYAVVLLVAIGASIVAQYFVDEDLKNGLFKVTVITSIIYLFEFKQDKQRR